MTDVVFSWKARYTITIGTSDRREHDITIDDPTETEIISSPFYKGDKENTRRYIVKRKADANVTRFCNHLAVETESPTSYSLNSLDFLENGERRFSQREVSIGASAQIGAPISDADFLSLEREVSVRSDSLLDSYSDLYNRYLKSKDVFEKYKLLYLIANKDAHKDLALKTIRNMLHHTELNCSHYPDNCKKAEELFGPGTISIQLSNPDHQRKVQEHLPKLRQMAKSIIDGLK
jgi:hypothetical protein